MWVQMDHDFGLPFVTLVVGLRKMTLEGLRMEACRTPEQVEALAEELQAYVVRHRPKLRGCRVIGISHRFGLRADIIVTHPSLPAVKMNEEGRRENLELCMACGEAIDANSVGHVVNVPLHDGPYLFREALVCDEHCANRLREPML